MKRWLLSLLILLLVAGCAKNEQERSVPAAAKQESSAPAAAAQERGEKCLTVFDLVFR